jgi:rare lipoprotein A
MMRRAWVLLAVLLAACGTRVPRPVVDRAELPPAATRPPPSAPSATPAGKPPAYVLKKGGGFYQDDGPGDNPPDNIDAIPDAVPKNEPLHRFANNPYSVLGRDYVPLRARTPYRARGVASWYGRKFHGQKTSSGESYDMYGMTAAHPTLPIPSYVRVSNPGNGRSVVLRVNDRGPFLHDRVIDLSYSAAWKLGYIGNGSTLVDVESVLPGQTTAPAQAPPLDDDPIARLVLAEPPPPVAPVLPEVKDARGIYLQLGAFSNADNAEALRGRLARELGGFAERLVVKPGGGMYRLQLGPWADREEARRTADKIAEMLEFKPVVVQR